MARPKVKPWVKVVHIYELDEDGNCPVCSIDYSECGCPGPTQDDCEFKEIKGVLYARKKENNHE